ncbi:MAG: hypothetical protein AAF593_04270 [Planctomycetota bacterium]
MKPLPPRPPEESAETLAGPAASPPPPRGFWRIWGRVLTLRFDAADIAALGHAHLAVGVMVVWAVGAGRYWDSPRAEVLQKLGVGSLIYVPVLALILWWVSRALRPERSGYVKLVTFLTLTAPPAVVYAIPIERWVSMTTAQNLNAWALGVVAVWRVAMYGRFLHVWNRLPAPALAVALLLPLTAIVFVLAMLNLEHVVFNIMGGLGQSEPSAADNRYAIVVLLAMFCFFLGPVLFVAWLILVVKQYNDRRFRQPPVALDESRNDESA